MKTTALALALAAAILSTLALTACGGSEEQVPQRETTLPIDCGGGVSCR